MIRAILSALRLTEPVAPHAKNDSPCSNCGAAATCYYAYTGVNDWFIRYCNACGNIERWVTYFGNFDSPPPNSNPDDPEDCCHLCGGRYEDHPGAPAFVYRLATALH